MGKLLPPFIAFMTKTLIGSILFISLLIYSSCQNQNSNRAQAETSIIPAAEAPVIKFSETTFDFGSVQEGAVVTHTFTFTNTGKTPLVIEKAVASCGCTVPDWPRKPIASGDKSEIKVEFNSQGKAGPQRKTITIFANTQPRESTLLLIGAVNAVQQP